MQLLLAIDPTAYGYDVISTQILGDALRAQGVDIHVVDLCNAYEVNALIAINDRYNLIYSFNGRALWHKFDNQ
ncbi:MAG: hypothetical protein MN733_30160, partial [Nitrososphaera sp.]|nr:hypothetical protein [Nitrososphaera sp.]